MHTLKSDSTSVTGVVSDLPENHQPVDATKRHLIDELVTIIWRKQRRTRRRSESPRVTFGAHLPASRRWSPIEGPATSTSGG